MKLNKRYPETINKVIQLSYVEANLQLLLREEPDILRQSFYENEYPDDDREFPEFPSNVY
jgi:hypothetical protein